MLVLTRREGEQLQIGPDILVTVVRVEGGGIRIGIEAPHDAIIMRSEIAHGVTNDEDLPSAK
jgi:carbon storage regulator